jgi:hypothetical protein
MWYLTLIYISHQFFGKVIPGRLWKNTGCERKGILKENGKARVIFLKAAGRASAFACRRFRGG